jgi:hypothetical protein
MSGTETRVAYRAWPKRSNPMRWRVLIAIGERKLLTGRCHECGGRRWAVVTASRIMHEWPHGGKRTVGAAPSPAPPTQSREEKSMR